MIREPVASHHSLMDAPEIAMPRVAEVSDAPSVRDDARITAIVRAEHDFIWRLLRRLGIPEASVDDATQQVFCVLSRRVDDIKPGSERSFLFGAALRVASDRRRSREFRDVPHEATGDEVDPAPNPEEIAERHEQRALLQEILEALPMELRAVIILF